MENKIYHFLAVCFLLVMVVSCTEDTVTSDWERVPIEATFIELDVRLLEEVAMRRDSVYVINTQEEWERLISSFPDSVGLQRDPDFQNHTVLAFTTFHDYNLTSSKASLTRNVGTNDYQLTFNYKLDELAWDDRYRFMFVLCTTEAKIRVDGDVPVWYSIHV